MAISVNFTPVIDKAKNVGKSIINTPKNISILKMGEEAGEQLSVAKGQLKTAGVAAGVVAGVTLIAIIAKALKAKKAAQAQEQTVQDPTVQAQVPQDANLNVNA